MKGTIFQLEHAFTVMELIITLVIVAILAAIAIPYTGNYLESRRLEGAAQAVMSELNLARSNALATNTATRLVVATGSSDAWCIGVTTASSCSCSTSGSCTLGATTGQAYKNISLTMTGYSGASNVLFSASRGTTTAAGSITLTSNSGAIIIETNQLGVSRMCSNDNLGGLDPC